MLLWDNCYLVALLWCLVTLQISIELAYNLAICLQIGAITWYECICLEKLKKDGIWIGLKLFQYEGIADNVLFEPAFFSLHQPVDLSFVSYSLVFSLEKIGDVVSEKIIGDDESFLAFLTLLASVAQTIRVIIVLAWGPY